MGNSIEIIRREEQKTTTWSGGTTTELAIYPKKAIYNNRNFKWRLSSAKVELEESTFTPLPNIWRHIMVLKGEMNLKHEGYHDIHLKPFDKDSFSGEWVTKSIGKVTDFNLMLAEGCYGEIKAIQIEIGKFFQLKARSFKCEERYTYFTEALYCARGNTCIVVNKKEKVSLNEGDLLLINLETTEKDVEVIISNEKKQCASLIRASILY